MSNKATGCVFLVKQATRGNVWGSETVVTYMSGSGMCNFNPTKIGGHSEGF